MIIPNTLPVSHPVPTTPQLPSSWTNSIFGVEKEFNVSDRNFTYQPHYVTFHIHPESLLIKEVFLNQRGEYEYQ